MLILGAPSSKSIDRGSLPIEAFGGEMVDPSTDIIEFRFFRMARQVFKFIRRLTRVKRILIMLEFLAFRFEVLLIFGVLGFLLNQVNLGF